MTDAERELLLEIAQYLVGVGLRPGVNLPQPRVSEIIRLAERVKSEGRG
jgi:hypothetical protein